MCHFFIDQFGCGHEDKNKLPCESMCNNGVCNETEDDHVNKEAGAKCRKCKSDEDEEDYINDQLRQFSEQDSREQTSAARPRDPNAPKFFLKQCIVWGRCGHHSHPRPTDIERDEHDPEWMHVDGRGSCFDCSKASSDTIAAMKANGDFEKEDPWGAMTRPEVGEGASTGTNMPSLEEIASGLTKKELQAASQQHAPDPPSPSPSPDRGSAYSISREPSPDFDDSPLKNKGRRGEPVSKPSAQPEDSDEDDDDSDDEQDRVPNKSSRNGGQHGHRGSMHAESESEEEDTDDEVDTRPLGHRTRRASQIRGHSKHESAESDVESDGESDFSDEAHSDSQKDGKKPASSTPKA